MKAKNLKNDFQYTLLEKDTLKSKTIYVDKNGTDIVHFRDLTTPSSEIKRMMMHNYFDEKFKIVTKISLQKLTSTDN